MPRTCTICSDNKVKEIETALIKGESFRRIASQFDVGEKSVERHKEHIIGGFEKAREKIQVKRAVSLTEQLDELRLVCDKILDSALTDNERDLALKAMDRRHKQLEIAGRLQGEFQQDKPNEAVEKKDSVKQWLLENKLIDQVSEEVQ